MLALLAAASSLPTILGLQLGAPVTIPECQRMVTRYPEPDGSPPPYQTEQSQECIMHESVKPDGVEMGMIVFPPTTMPTLMSFNWVGDRLVGGRLAELGVATLDYNHAAFIVGQLTAKFGKPDSDTQSSEDIDSIAVPARVVVWKRPGFRVEYRSVNKTVERGLVLVQTDEELRAEQQEDAAAKAQQTPF